MELVQFVERTTVPDIGIATRRAEIHVAALRKSQHLDEANFTTIHPDDLKFLFDAYDDTFFDGRIRERLGPTPLSFNFSKRMTSAGGTTTERKCRIHGHKTFEIRISLPILWGCFDGDDHRPLLASSIECRNRLEALQLILEHEIVHLIEFLAWDHSSCSRPRFQSIARRFFGHKGHKHQLITPRERAYVRHGVAPGVTVRFAFEGTIYTGIVNRVTKRATVLVEDPDGEEYTSGKKYSAYYIPVRDLEVVNP